MKARQLRSVTPPALHPTHQRRTRRQTIAQPPRKPTHAYGAQPCLDRRHHLHPHREGGGWLYLVVDTLRQAIGSRTRDPTATTILHSDRGSQYSSTAFRQLLAHSRITQSMSARANPYHNAWTESFIGTLKTEMLRDGSFLCETDAKFEIFEYIEMYYNNQRKHSSLRYQTPAQFEQTVILHN